MPTRLKGASDIMRQLKRTILAAVFVSCSMTPVFGQELPTTGGIETRIGQLSFEGGYPTHETVDKLYDEMDFQRATQAYLWAIPLIGFAQWQAEHENVFGAKDGDVVYYVSYRDKLGLLTSNATTPYIVGFLNLSRTGPLVID
jgi:hypothetical protein